MKENVKVQTERKKPQYDPKASPMSLKPSTKEQVVFRMKPEEEIILLKDLLGNFSDQTGASFG
jgi:hypothetical protein